LGRNIWKQRSAKITGKRRGHLAPNAFLLGEKQSCKGGTTAQAKTQGPLNTGWAQ